MNVGPSIPLAQLLLRSLFCLVRHSTATTSVCICLSRAATRGSLLLLVAIE